MTEQPVNRSTLSTRRAFLQRAALAGATLWGLEAMLTACDGSASSGVEGPSYPLARPGAPVTWPVDQRQVIASDLPPEEEATLRVLSWPNYLAPSVVASFERTYRCRVEIREFPDMDAGLDAMETGAHDADLMVGMALWALGRSIASGSLRPLNLDYVPNLADNCWASLQSPFYDVGSRYSVPYSVWTTGIVWRNDKIGDDIASMANPYDFFWNGAPVNKTHVLSNARDVVSMPMFRDGLTDVNVTDPAIIQAATDAMATVMHATNGLNDHSDDVDVPGGRAYLHQAWSGNVTRASILHPRDVVAKLSFVWPVDSGVPGNIDSDTLVLLNGGRAPVLAHLLLNHLLEANNAMTNFATCTGYQMPQNSMTLDTLSMQGPAPQHLANVYLAEEDFDRGSRQLELSPAGNILWREAYIAVAEEDI